MAETSREGGGRSGSRGTSGAGAKRGTRASKPTGAAKASSTAKSASGAKARTAKSGNAGKPAAKTSRPRRSAKSRAVEAAARSYFEALATRDLDAVVGHWSAEGVEDIVALGVFRGPDEVRHFMGGMFAAFPDSEFVVDRVTADDSVAAVQWRMTGTFTGGPFQGVEPTGRRLELRGCDCLEIEDGKITRNTAYYDGAAFARGIGLLPAQDSGAEKAMVGTLNAVTKLRKAVGERMGSYR